MKLSSDDEAQFIYLVRGLLYGAASSLPPRAEFDPEVHEVGLE